MRDEISWSEFKKYYLVKDLRDKFGKPKHTRFVKKLFYRFDKHLKTNYNFDMYKCSDCGISEWNGRPVVMELDHINRVTNDSRLTNLRMLCPNCHSQTDGYKNRSVPIEHYHERLRCA